MNDGKLNRHARRRLNTIAKLKEATLELLLEKGYDTVSIQDITDRADLGRGTFYIYFGSKEEIVWSILEDGFKRTADDAVQRFNNKLPDNPEFISYVNIFEHAQQNKNLYRVMLGSQGSSLLTNRVQEYLVSDFVQDMKNFDVYNQLDLPQEISAHIITGALFSLLVWWLETPNQYSPAEMAEMLCKVLHRKD